MKNKGKKWTDEEDVVIIRLRKRGKSIPEIAKTLERTYGATSMRVSKLIGECKIKKKRYTPTKRLSVGYMQCTQTSPTKIVKGRSKMDAAKILQYVSETPWNIQSAFRRYSEESGFSVSSIHSFYYHRNKARTRLKDRGAVFTLVGKQGHTIENGKNTNHLWSKSNIWKVLKDFFTPRYLS